MATLYLASEASLPTVGIFYMMYIWQALYTVMSYVMHTKLNTIPNTRIKFNCLRALAKNVYTKYLTGSAHYRNVLCDALKIEHDSKYVQKRV